MNAIIQDSIERTNYCRIGFEGNYNAFAHLAKLLKQSNNQTKHVQLSLPHLSNVLIIQSESTQAKVLYILATYNFKNHMLEIYGSNHDHNFLAIGTWFDAKNNYTSKSRNRDR